MINVLYLSYDGMTDPLGQSQVLPYLRGLSKEGYQFHLISFEKEERFEKNRAHIQFICDEAGIVWHPQPYTKKPPLLSTIKDVRRMRKVAHQLHKLDNFKIVHCRSYISALVGLGMKRKFGTKFLFDMRGFWADERIDGGIWSLKNPIFKLVYKYFKRKEIEFFKEADYVVSLTFNGKQEIESWKTFNGNPPRIEVIPCCTDLELFNPAAIGNEDKELLRNKLGIKPDDFVLGYVGSIGTWYMLDEMLDYFKELLLQKPASKFLFVTGEPESLIRNSATLKGIKQESILITSSIHKEVPLHLSLFTESIFFIRPTYSKKASSPTKQGEIMAMGIPLVCNAGVGDTDRIVEQYNAGIVIENLNQLSYSSAVQSSKDINQEALISGAKDYFSLAEGTKRYLKIYQSII